MSCFANRIILLSDSFVVVFFLIIHRYDARDKYAHRPRHWSDENVLGKRAFFTKVQRQQQQQQQQQKQQSMSNKSSSGAGLMIDNVHESDAGLYRCRVDFKRSPTRNSRVNLTVVGEWWYSLIAFSSLYILDRFCFTKWAREDAAGELSINNGSEIWRPSVERQYKRKCIFVWLRIYLMGGQCERCWLIDVTFSFISMMCQRKNLRKI